MSDNSLSVEDKLEFWKLKEKHKSVFENEEIESVGNFVFKSSAADDSSEEKYNANHKKAIKGLGLYLKGVLN